MARETGILGNKPRRSLAGLWGFLAGCIVGGAAGWGGPRVLHHFAHEEPTTDKKAVKQVAIATPKPAGGHSLRLIAQPAQRGLLVAADSPVKMLKTSESQRAMQQGNAMFTGFKNWVLTAQYLGNGQGTFVVKDAAGLPIDTGWDNADYISFVKGQSLQAPVPTGQPMTLFFQRKGQRPIDLGTFNVSAPAAAAPKAAVAAPTGTVKSAGTVKPASAAPQSNGTAKPNH